MSSYSWQYVPIIPALTKLVDGEFHAGLGNVVRLSQKIQIKTNQIIIKKSTLVFLLFPQGNTCKHEFLKIIPYLKHF